MLDSLREEFYARQMLNPLSCGQVALWHALAYICEKAHNQEWFTVAGISLAQLSGLSPSGVKKARNELKQTGFIDFKPNGTRATSYRLIADSVRVGSQDSVRVGSQDSVRVGSQDSSRIGSRNSSALYTPPSNKKGGGVACVREGWLTDAEMDAAREESITGTQRLIDAMEAAGMKPNTTLIDKALALAAEHGLDAVVGALDKAVEQDKRGGVNLAFVKTILESAPKIEKPAKRTVTDYVYIDGERQPWTREVKA